MTNWPVFVFWGGEGWIGVGRMSTGRERRPPILSEPPQHNKPQDQHLPHTRTCVGAGHGGGLAGRQEPHAPDVFGRLAEHVWCGTAWSEGGG